MVIAYLRVSTSKQHLINQRQEISRYARLRGLSVDKWYNDIISGKIGREQRSLGKVIRDLGPGDILIVTEISRLSRRLVEIMNIIQECVKKRVVLHSIKEGYIFEDNLNSKILGFAFGLVAEIERNLISIRTKEALAVRKASGMKLGRPAGSGRQSSHLEAHRREVMRLVAGRVPYKKIAAGFGVSPCTLRRFIKKHGTACGPLIECPREEGCSQGNLLSTQKYH